MKQWRLYTRLTMSHTTHSLQYHAQNHTVQGAHAHMSQLQRPPEFVFVDAAPPAIRPHRLFEHVVDVAIAS
jgi:hypothetical protein